MLVYHHRIWYFPVMGVKRSRGWGYMLALIHAVFHISHPFWAQENRHPKNSKIFFQDKFSSLKSHAHNFTILIYSATWRAAKLCIFTHFTFKNLSQYSQSINSLIYVYSIQIPSCFLWVLDHCCDHTSLYYHHPKKFSVLQSGMFLKKGGVSQMGRWKKKRGLIHLSAL